MGATLQQIEIRVAERETLVIESKIPFAYCLSDPKSVKNAENHPKSIGVQWNEKCFLIERDVPALLKAGKDAVSRLEYVCHLLRIMIANNNIAATPELIHELANVPNFADLVDQAWQSLPISVEVQKSIDARYGPKPDPNGVPGQQGIDFKPKDLSNQTSASIKPHEMAEGGPVKHYSIAELDGQLSIDNATDDPLLTMDATGFPDYLRNLLRVADECGVLYHAKLLETVGEPPVLTRDALIELREYIRAVASQPKALIESNTVDAEVVPEESAEQMYERLQKTFVDEGGIPLGAFKAIHDDIADALSYEGVHDRLSFSVLTEFEGTLIKELADMKEQLAAADAATKPKKAPPKAKAPAEPKPAKTPRPKPGTRKK